MRLNKLALRLAIAVSAAAALQCSSRAPAATPVTGSLELMATHRLAITEPSGLTLDDSAGVLWTVTNNPDFVYQLDLYGHTLKKLRYAGEDLEGIAYDSSDRTLWVVEENRREVVHLDLEGNVLERQSLGLAGKKNSGLEGICLDHAGHMFVLNEKKPGLFIELKPDHTIATQQKLTFAGDYSDLFATPQPGCFWILSDQSQALYLWDKNKGVLRDYVLPFPKPEGVAVDDVTKRVYVVSDSTNMLYVFKMANTGSGASTGAPKP